MKTQSFVMNLLLLLPLAGVAACGGSEHDPAESESSALRRSGLIGDPCTVPDVGSGKCSNDACTECKVDGTCWFQSPVTGDWLICLKPFPGK